MATKQKKTEKGAMEFTTHKDTLMLALGRAKGVVEKKTTMPILTNILIRSEASDLISLKATDLELSLEGTYAVDVTEPGGFCVPAVKFLDVVRALPSGNVNVKLNPETNKAEVRGEKGAFFQLFTVPVEDYPNLPSTEGVQLYPIEAATLRGAFSFVLPAAGTDDPRVYLNSVYVENKGKGKLRFVSTDGHKLALIEKDAGGELPMKRGVIIPRKAATEIQRLLEESELKDVKIGFSDNHGFFTSERLTFSFRLVDSTYPNYEMVIPNAFNHEVKTSREEFTESIARITVLAAERNAKVKLEIKENGMLATYRSAEYGSSEQPIEAQMKGEPVTLGFTASTLIEILKIFTQPNVTLRIQNAETPVRVECEDFTEGFGVVMPVKLEYMGEDYEE